MKRNLPTSIQPRSPRANKRSLSLEPLEDRRLLASASDHGNEWPVAVTITTTVPIAADLAAASDPGSTPDAAARLGPLDGTRQLRGSLNRFDMIDTFQFTVDRQAEVAIGLFGLKRNADLYLVDESGKSIQHSNKLGRNAESLNASLAAGDYYLAVVAATFAPTAYRLTLSAALQPEPAPVPPPVIPPPVASAQPDPESPAVEMPDEAAGGSPPVLPLADVPYFGGRREWNLNAIGAPEAWAAGYTGHGILVAVVDTGVDLDHPDLVQNLYVNPAEIPGNGIDDDGNGFVDDLSGYDFVAGNANPDDLNGHGTHVAGTIAAVRNRFGATGVAPAATILPVRVLDENGSGSDVDVAAGIRYAAQLGARIINLSLGGSYSHAIDAAIDFAHSLGSLVVAAAGNESAPLPSYPARLSATDENIISVGAYSSAGGIAAFSNDVGNSRSIQVDAPGVGIYSTYVGGRYAISSGTSMAAPHIAGLAALTLSANPDLTTRELRDLLATGTVTRVAGSDAIGAANAVTTVAYAAAGLKTAPAAAVATPPPMTQTPSAQRATRVRATTIAVDRLFARPESIETQELEEMVLALGEVAFIASLLPQPQTAAMASPNPHQGPALDACFASEPAAENIAKPSAALEVQWWPLASHPAS